MAVPRLYPVDCFLAAIKRVHGDYIYYATSSIKLVRVHQSDLETTETIINDVTALTDAAIDEVVADIFVTPSGALILTTLATAALQWSAWSSTDGGSTWSSRTLEIGSDGSTWHTKRKLLGQHNFANVTFDDGTAGVLLAEYNTKADAPFDTHVWKTIDDGVTWSRFWQGRTGSTGARFHMHSVYQNPFTNKIIITGGDTGNDASLIMGNASSDWSNIDGLTPDLIEAEDSSFTVLYGDQKYRIIDILFKEDYMYSHTDSGESGGAQAGIYRISHDLTTTFQKMFDPNALDTEMIIGSGGIITQAGLMVFCDYLAAAPGVSNSMTMRVHVSTNGASWFTVAKWLFRTNRTSDRWASHIGQLGNGKIVIGGICSSNAPGKTVNQTMLLEERGTWNAGLGEETIMPVYWVSPHGSDSNDGFTSRTPWLTLKKALENDLITYGTRIMLTEGNHSSDGAVLDYQANAAPAQKTNTSTVYTENAVVVEGIEGQTRLEIDTDDSGYGVQGDASDGDITFRHIRVISNYGSDLFVDSGTYDGTDTDNTTKGEINWR